MKYVGMPFGMWVLFAGSFQKQLIAVLWAMIQPLQERKKQVYRKGLSPP